MICLACSIFKQELEQLRARGEFNLPVVYLDSMLHMEPDKLHRRLDARLKKELARGKRVLILFGDCHPYLNEQEALPGVYRIRGLNCSQILVGYSRYRELIREGAFFLLPEWTHRWREVFEDHMGFSREVARDFMREMHRKLVYLDTGREPVPRAVLSEISAFTGLPWEVMEVGPEGLVLTLNRVMEQIEQEDVRDAGTGTGDLRPVGFQNLAMDIVENILREAGDVDAMAGYLTMQMRELTGAHTIVLLQCRHNFGGSGHRVVYVRPERRRELAEAVTGGQLPRLMDELEEPTVWGQGKGIGGAEKILKGFDCGLSIAAPLKVGGFRVGTLLLLGLPLSRQIPVVLEILNVLSPVAALVFRNSLLYEKQEAIIEQRTRELKESERLLQTAQRLAHVGSWAFNRETRHMHWSEEVFRLLGHGVGGVKPSLEVLLEHVRSDERERVREGIEGGGSYSDEFCLHVADGSERIVHVVAQSGTGSNVCYGALQDITVRKEMEAERERMQNQLRQVQKMEAIGTLAGGIAHDFNNILSAIIGYTELALIDMTGETQAKENLDQVVKASYRARDLVKQILSFSRADRPERRPIRLEPVIRDALKLLRATIPATIDIRCRTNGDGQWVLADGNQVHQVLMNLASNAAHAMPGGGILEIALDPVGVEGGDTPPCPGLMPGEYVRLTVRDTGQGMDGATLDRIFEPFFTTKEPGEGTGMGLSVVHGIVVGHGGAIDVDSAPGKGTTFRVYFPVLRKAARPVDPNTTGGMPRGSEHILLVDDETAVVDMVRKILERLGYRVTVCDSAIGALDLFRASPDDFDLVMTDMTMPRMTGDRLAAEMMRLRPEIPIILCTGYNAQISPETATKMGIRRMIMKPLATSRMAAVIREVLGTTPAPPDGF